MGRTQYLYDELLLVNDLFAMAIQEFNRHLVPFIQQHPLSNRTNNYSGDLNPALSLHKFLIGKSPFLPNVFDCVAVYSGRYFFGQDGLIYPWAEVIGVRSAAVGTYAGGLRWNENYQRWGQAFFSDPPEVQYLSFSVRLRRWVRRAVSGSNRHFGRSGLPTQSGHPGSLSGRQR